MAQPAKQNLDPAAVRSKAALSLPGGRGGIVTLISTLTALLTQTSGVNWHREAGKLWENSAVAIGLKWYATTAPEAPFCVTRRASDGSTQIVPDHPLTLLLRQPRGQGKRGGAAVPASNLWAATILSLKVDGNAYWVLRRNEYTNRVVAIEYIPHWCLEPDWTDDTEYITHYRYRIGSQQDQMIPVENVIHFRDGIDPENTRKGMSALRSLLREVVSDNEATAYTAAILKNMGVPGVLITPKADKTGVIKKVSEGFKERVKELWKQVTRGDSRGDAVVFDEPFDVTMPGWTPEQLALDRIRQVPEARIIAALQIPAMVVGLSVGDNQRTYANMREAREMAYESSVIPLLSMLADTLQVQLLPQITGRADESCGFDLTQVRVLQTDLSDLWTRAREAWESDGITRAEYRAMLGYEVDDARDNVFFSEVQAQAIPGETTGTPPSKSHRTTTLTKEEARALLLESACERRLKAERGETEEEGTPATAEQAPTGTKQAPVATPKRLLPLVTKTGVLSAR